MRVCVVGAGPAGLCAAKHSRRHGLAVTVFEQSGDVGGTWRYTECVDRDEHGAPVHTSMYRDLRTNLPKHIVMYPDFPHKNLDESFVPSEKILQYLKDYSDTFALRNLCKFHHQVTRICLEKNGWSVTVLDILSTKEVNYTFDVVFICNGLNNKPFTPELEGSTLFEGLSMHSHDYRTPEPFIGQTVLIVGGGPSGLDLSNNISRCSAKVLFSHHSPWINMGKLKLPENVLVKPDVKRLLKESVEFMDGTIEKIDCLIYCTGFRCDYSFLDKSCGITVDDGFVYPLYKHIINANHPSMCILGNLNFSLQLSTFDIQVRFFIKSLANNILPTKEKMIGEIEEYIEKKLGEGKRKKNFFNTIADEDVEYYQQLVSMADIEPLPKVLNKIFARAAIELVANFPRFRQYHYKILDDDNFTVTFEVNN